ncbi:MAG: hypothetical protein Q8K86_00145 [Candidatus Nanopelagicaceae bacterium]|nr:hypothetical protein [Candidatus Nanopelagicaceae bacterium]
MANLISRGNISLTGANTWYVADINPQAAHSASTNTTVADVASSAFALTNGAVLSGQMMFCKQTTVTGTVTVKLKKSGVQVASVTVNATDLPTKPGWVFFSYGASPYTVDVATSVYTVTIVASSAGNATFYRDATAGNWTRLFATATTGTAGAASVLYCVGDLTGAAAGSTYTITADDTSGANAYGNIEVGHCGVLSQLTTATQYYLSITGDFLVWGGGVVTLGDSTHGITITITFNCGSNVQYGLTVNDGGSWESWGATKTGSAFLAADAVATDTALTTDVSTAWLSGDVIALAPTGTLNTESETKALTGNAVGTALAITAISYDHSGDAAGGPAGEDTRAELINLTRTFKVAGASTTNQSYLYFTNYSTVTMRYVEMYYLGSATALKYGIVSASITGCDIQYCAVHDCLVSAQINNPAVAGVYAFNFSYNVLYNVATNTSALSAVSNYGSITSTITQNYNILIYCGAITYYTPRGATHVMIGCRVAGSVRATGGFTVDSSGNLSSAMGTWKNHVAHSCVGPGFSIASATMPPGADCGGLTAWRNATYGLAINTGAPTLTGVNTFFGNVTAHIYLQAGTMYFRLVGGIFNSEVSYPTPLAIRTSNSTTNTIGDMYLENCSFGQAVAHTSDFDLVSTAHRLNKLVLRNCIYNTISNVEDLNMNEFIYIQNDDGSWLVYEIQGSRLRDATYKSEGSYSQKCLQTAGGTWDVPLPLVCVKAGETPIISVDVRKSAAPDTVWDGSEPQLVMLADPVQGWASDVVLDTADDDAGQFQTISGALTAAGCAGMVRCVVRLTGGTAGFINVDNARASSKNGSGSLDYSFDGEPGSGSMRQLGDVQCSFAG